jgi:isopenicillin-N N-acyltransferase-like protein
LSDEEPWFRLEVKYGSLWREWSAALRGNGEACSALGVGPQGDRPPIVAENMDTPHYYDGYQVLLHLKPPDSDLEALVFTIAGKISLAGLNSAGVGICCNSLLQLDFSRNGLPEDFVVRGTLAQPTLDEALTFMQRVRHASGQNYVLGGPERVVDLEVSANKICEFVPHPGAELVCHTNHPLVNDEQGTWHERIEMAPPHLTQPFLSRSTSHARLATLTARLGGSAGSVRPPGAAITLDAVQAALSSHDGPVCIDGDGAKITLGCLIMELSTPPVLHLSPGPPCSTPFRTHRFNGV